MKKQLTYFIGILTIAIILCGVLTYNTFGNQTVKSENGYIFSAEDSKQGLEIIRTFRTETGNNISGRLLSEINSFHEYVTVLEIEKRGFRDYGMPVFTEEQKKNLHAKYTFGYEQAKSRMQMLEYLSFLNEYCDSYSQYNAYVQNQAGKLMNISIFSDFNQENIRKTGRDFYLGENIQPIPIVTLGISLYLDSNFAGYIMILTAIVCAWVALNPLQKNDDTTLKKGTNIWLSVLLFGGMAAIAFAQFVVVRLLWGMDTLSVPVQSLPAFKTCRYNLSVSEMLLIQTVLKCVGSMVIFWLLEAVCSLQKRMYLGVIVGAFILLLDQLVFGNWLFKAFFASEHVIGIYKNVSLFGVVVSEVVLWSVAVIIIVVLSIVIANSQLRKLELLRKEKNEQIYFEEINDRYNEIRVLRHDINNHLSAVSYLLEEGRVEDARKYLDGIGSELQDTRLPEKTGIDALDMILWRKLSQAKDKDIKIHLDIRESLRNTSLSDYEMCSLFGNMIDNAVEAVLKLDSGRDIHLKIIRQMDMVCIFCENPYLSVNRENGKFVTSKTDFKNHGLGIRQMEHIAKKHGGTVHITTENNLFTVSVLLQISEA